MVETDGGEQVHDDLIHRIRVEVSNLTLAYREAYDLAARLQVQLNDQPTPTQPYSGPVAAPARRRPAAAAPTEDVEDGRPHMARGLYSSPPAVWSACTPPAWTTHPSGQPAPPYPL